MIQDHYKTGVLASVGITSPVTVSNPSHHNSTGHYYNVTCDKYGTWFVREDMIVPESVWNSPLWRALNEV